MPWTLLSVIVGGLVAAGSGILTAFLQQRHERRSLMHAFAGEIGAVVDIVRRRDYLGHITKHLAAARRGESVVPKTFTGAQSYFRIYEANAGRIGLLPGGLAADVARFYTFAISLLEDLTSNRPAASEPAAMAGFLCELEQVVRGLLDLGDGILVHLEPA